MFSLGKYSIGKECGGKLFPGIGHGYWDGLYYYIFRSKKINLKFRTFSREHPMGNLPPYHGFAIGPLMFWKEK